MVISLNRGPVWGTWRAHLPGALWMKRHYEETPWRGSGGAPSLGTLEDVLGKSLDMCSSLYGGRFPVEGNRVCERARTPGTLLDGGRRALVVGHLPVRDSMKGALEGGLLCFWVFGRLARFPVDGPLSPWGPCWGT
jgi:hypothetical protein